MTEEVKREETPEEAKARKKAEKEAKKAEKASNKQADSTPVGATSEHPDPSGVMSEAKTNLEKDSEESDEFLSAASAKNAPAKDSIQAATEAGEVLGRPQAGSYPEDKMLSCGMSVANVAELCHEANRAHCQIHGDDSQKPWVQAPEWQRKSAIEGVLNILRHRNPSPGMSHSNWMKLKAKEGWVYGEKKDEAKKTHPCMVGFAQLPPHQQAKDHLFYGIVMGFKKSE